MAELGRHTIRLKGLAGVIRWGYTTAATVKDWSIENGASGCDLTATVEHADAFRLSQTPLTFEAHVGSGIWKWPIVSVSVADGVLVAHLQYME